MIRYAILLLISSVVMAQHDSIPDFDAIDPKYREDQFYISMTYNIWQRRPDGVRQNKFSPGVSIGFLRDMPINERRTWAIAAGLGYAYQNFAHNVFIARPGDEAYYSTIPADADYEKNKISFHFAELPIEIRWRTSTPESHKFWRVYTGFKLSYLFADRYKFDGDGGSFIIKSNDDLNRLIYGVYLSTGYNTWNFHIYYSLNPMFKSAEFENGTKLEMQTLNVGLMFYIL